MKRAALVVLVVAGLAAPSLGEAYSTGFEYADTDAMLADGWVFTAFNPNLTTSTVRSGNQALVLSPRVHVERPLNEFGTLNLWVYDEGLISPDGTDAWGARWGLAKGNEVIGGHMFDRSYMDSAVAYGVNTGFVNNSPTGQWFSTTWMDAGDITSPGGANDSRSRGVPGWMNWEIGYYPDGTITIDLLVDPNGGGAKAYSGRDVGVPGPVAPDSVEFADPATGGAEAIYLFGSWQTEAPLPFGDLIVDDLTWTPYEGGVCNPGDADGDGDVDLDDFVILKNNFGTTEGATCAMGDFDEDGDVDLDDFVLLKNAFGTTY